MKKTKIDHYTDKEALEFHSHKKPGKLEIIASKNMTTKRDLALAYSPGVAVPVKKISENPEAAYDYTSKGNLVAVIRNGSAILGMGDLGALASKPVMEGKSVLFKRFADIDSIDLEIDSKNTDEIIKFDGKNVVGTLKKQGRKNIFKPNNDLKKNYWFSLDREDVLSFTGKEFSEYIIYLNGNYTLPKPKKITANVSNNHKKYAITWFSLAISILLLYLYFRKKNY